MIQLTYEPIDSTTALAHVQTSAAGAVVLFLGTTREFTNGRQTLRLEYESYPSMAERKLGELERAAADRWPIVRSCIIHRLGRVDLGEASVLVAVSTPHRRDAFAAASWLMDQIKQEVPIWKQEQWADGQSSWIHPVDANSDQPPNEA